ncbi:MAG: DUF1778 domain-containing protein [Rhizonema sp. PD38]|nr:DUF1778 domain-containing protein [Rhizonema sp. PD38]
MSIPSEMETTTIKLTISLEHKKTLEKAAAQRNVSLNDYLLEIALEAAGKVSLSMFEIRFYPF